MNMSGKVAVAEQEPILIAVAGQLLHRIVGVIANTPAVCGIDDTSQRIQNDIDIRRNVQAIKLAVVSCIGDDGNLLLGDDLDHSLQEAGSSNTTGKNDYHVFNNLNQSEQSDRLKGGVDASVDLPQRIRQ